MRRGLLAGLLCASLGGVALAGASPVGAPTPVLVAAHRGGAALAPENTMAAFRNAQALFAAHPGVDGWLEMDARMSGTGMPVVIHDDTLDRTTDCTGRVIDMWVNQLMQCNAAENWPAWGFQGVPTVLQVLTEGARARPAWKIMLEIKDIPIALRRD